MDLALRSIVPHKKEGLHLSPTSPVPEGHIQVSLSSGYLCASCDPEPGNIGLPRDTCDLCVVSPSGWGRVSVALPSSGLGGLLQATPQTRASGLRLNSQAEGERVEGERTPAEGQQRGLGEPEG